MNKKLKALKRALKDLDNHTKWGKFTDESSEWLELSLINGHNRIDITIDGDGEFEVFKIPRLDGWDEENMEKLI